MCFAFFVFFSFLFQCRCADCSQSDDELSDVDEGDPELLSQLQGIGEVEMSLDERISTLEHEIHDDKNAAREFNSQGFKQEAKDMVIAYKQKEKELAVLKSSKMKPQLDELLLVYKKAAVTDKSERARMYLRTFKAIQAQLETIAAGEAIPAEFEIPPIDPSQLQGKNERRLCADCQ